MSGLLRLPIQFGTNKWVRPGAVNVISITPGSAQVDVVVEGVGLYITAHCTDPEHAAGIVGALLALLGGGS